MRGDIFNAQQIPAAASKDEPMRIVFDKKKNISCVVENTSLSGQTLWVGVNSEDAIKPLEPGESFPIAARENAYLRGFLTVRWDDVNAATVRSGIVTYGLDAGEQNDC